MRISNELDALKHLPFYEHLRRIFAGESRFTRIVEFTGMEVLATGEGTCSVAFDVDRRFANPAGTLQGGMLTTVADMAIGLAFLSRLKPDEHFTSLDIKVNFFKPVRDGRLEFHAEVVHRGRSTGLVNCDVFNQDEVLVAQVNSTCFILPNDNPD